ncbi:MAG: hypothetical protein JWM72_3670 [Actinomycetia bacterium]|jgi:hypothetical protein|nr:hypothetical protein [Actinomycetes bacterium]MDQ1458760.1 hypothetical protein [Actinomycetota bacterium]
MTQHTVRAGRITEIAELEAREEAFAYAGRT